MPDMYVGIFPVKIISGFFLITDCFMLKTDDGEKWTFKLSSNFTIIYFLRSDGISSLILDGEDFRRLNYVMS